LLLLTLNVVILSQREVEMVFCFRSIFLDWSVILVMICWLAPLPNFFVSYVHPLHLDKTAIPRFCAFYGIEVRVLGWAFGLLWFRENGPYLFPPRPRYVGLGRSNFGVLHSTRVPSPFFHFAVGVWSPGRLRFRGSGPCMRKHHPDLIFSSACASLVFFA